MGHKNTKVFPIDDNTKCVDDIRNQKLHDDRNSTSQPIKKIYSMLKSSNNEKTNNKQKQVKFQDVIR